MGIRVNLELPLSAKKLLDEKATNISVQDVIRIYIKQGLAIDSLIENGGEVICIFSDGRRVSIESLIGEFK